MKKIISVLMVMTLLALTFTGCSCSKKSTDSSTASNAKVYRIGICQLLEHAALDKATQGFQEKLTELLGKDNVEFDLQNAQGETTNCSTIASGFVADKVDLMMGNATAALQACAAASSEIPVVGTSITDYGTALEIENFTGKTGSNVTGASDLAPLDQQAAMIKELVPGVKTVGLLYCSAEPNSVYQIKEIEKNLDEMGIAYKEFTAADSNEIQSVVTKAIAECNALYIPTDNTIAANTEIVNNICEPAKIPVIAGETSICSGCGIATLSFDYYDVGVAAAELAYEILVNGANPGELEIRTAPAVTKCYVPARCELLGITIPEGYTPIQE